MNKLSILVATLLVAGVASATEVTKVTPAAKAEVKKEVSAPAQPVKSTDAALAKTTEVAPAKTDAKAAVAPTTIKSEPKKEAVKSAPAPASAAK